MSSAHPTYRQQGVCPPEELPADLFSRLSAAGALDPEAKLSLENGFRLFSVMGKQRQIDERMLTLQRQGRIGFYGACTGQEASVFGTAAAAEPTDWVQPALREAGILLFRGFPLQSYFDQLLGNSRDVTQGRQMPCHPPGGGYHYVTMSSVIANQIPQSCGLALASQLRRDGRVTLCYMGDGATSEGDFHTGLNVAALKKLPILFICQNNQWSISVPVGRQTAAESMAAKAEAYGMPARRVDGNDVFAVWEAARELIDHARSGGGPAFLECLTYRLGAHTTSDDPTRYRDEGVTERWKNLDPLERLGRLFRARGMWDDDKEEAQRAAVDLEIRSTWACCEPIPPPDSDSVLLDVFATPTPQLVEQMEGLRRSIARGAGSGGHG